VPIISLVFPTYNAGPTVDETWSAARDFVLARPDRWEVLFVCDGPSDGTSDRLHALAAQSNDPRFRVLAYEPNRGKGHAVRVGMLAARGKYRVFTDVDLAYRFDDIARVADELRSGAAVVIASREHEESQIQLANKCVGYAFRRWIQSRVFGKIARTLLPIQSRDTQAGLKGMTAAVAERVLPNLACDGFGFDCELLTAFARYRIPVTEVPVLVRYGDAATSTGGTGTMLRMMRDLWRIRRRWAANAFPADVIAETISLTNHRSRQNVAA